MEPKFRSIVRDPKYKDNAGKQILFADFDVTPNNLDFAESLGVENVPTVRIIVPGGFVQNISCPPSKMHRLKRKLYLYLDGSPVTSTYKP